MSDQTIIISFKRIHMNKKINVESLSSHIETKLVMFNNILKIGYYLKSFN